MKKFVSLFIASLVLASSFAFVPVKEKTPKLYASQVMIPIGKEGKKISLLELSTISKENLEKLTGRKMTGGERFAFKISQKKLKKGINAEGVVTNKKLKKAFFEGETGFNIGGFALGFLLGLIGVLIAYILNDEKKQNRRKWAWIGFGVALVLYLIIVLAFVSKNVP